MSVCIAQTDLSSTAVCVMSASMPALAEMCLASSLPKQKRSCHPESLKLHAVAFVVWEGHDECMTITVPEKLKRRLPQTFRSCKLHQKHHNLPGLQMEACLVAIPSSETLVDFAFYKPGQIALLLKDRSRVSHGGSTSCRLVIFPIQDLPFMLLERYSNGTNQLSQHVFEVRSCLITLSVCSELAEAG